MCEMSPAAVLLAMVVLTLTPPSLADTCALYDPPALGIHCFQGNALDRVVTSSKTLWMIEFYSSWCGHCQHFAPVMKEIGAEIEAWSSTFKLGVVECSGSKDSQNACNRHKIQAYPTLKVVMLCVCVCCVCVCVCVRVRVWLLDHAIHVLKCTKLPNVGFLVCLLSTVKDL